MPDVHGAARAAWTKHAADLIRYEGVISVEPGRRTRRGRRTTEDVVVVTVVQKLDPKELTAGQLIPRSLPLDEGGTVGTDVVEDPAGYPTIEQDSAAYRPVPGGCEIGAINSGFLGTLGGWFCQSRPAGGFQPVWLTNAHVADPATRSQVPADARVTQPAGGDVIGSTTAVDGWPNPLPAAGVTVPAVNDAAVGVLDEGVDQDYEVLQIGDAPFEVDGAVANQAVQKRGRTTLLTNGTVQSVGITANVRAGTGLGLVTFGLPGNPPLHRVTSNAAGLAAAFGAPGDSGSLVFGAAPGRLESTFPCVGLYFAGTFRAVSQLPNPNNVTVTGLMLDIQAVMGRLNLSTVCNCVIRQLLEAIFGRADARDSGDAAPRADAMLRRFRDKTLARSSRGKVIAAAIAESAPAASRVLAQDPHAFDLAVDLLAPWAAAATGPGLLTRTIDDETVDRALELAKYVTECAGDDLGHLAAMSETIEKYRGKSVLSLIGRRTRPKLRRTAGEPNPKGHTPTTWAMKNS